MTLDDIEVFAEVVDVGSFTKAAKRLNIPTSTASSKVARLEEKLGTTLLLRTTRQVNVTAEGQKYYQHCVLALTEMAEAERELAEGATEPSGRLRLTAPADLTHSLLSPIIDIYLARYPLVSVDLILSNRQVDLVSEGINLAIRVGKLSDSNLKARRFFDTRVGLWASSDYLERCGVPETVEELVGHTMIELKLLQNKLTLLGKNNRALEINFSGRLSTDDMQTCRLFIQQGAGIGTLPNFIGCTASEGSQLVRVLPELASVSASAYFVYPEQRFVPQTVRAFIDCALEHSNREY